MLQALAIETGQKMMNEPGNEVYLTAPKTVAALDYWVDLSRKHNVMPTGSVDWATLRTDFLEGKTAMMWHTTGNLTAVKDAAKFPFGVAMLPAKASSGARRPAAAASTSVEERLPRAAEGGRQVHPVDDDAGARCPVEHGDRLRRGVACRLRDRRDAELCQAGFPQATVARDQPRARGARARPSTRTAASTSALNDALQAALTGTQKPQEALAAAQAQADRVLRACR